MYASMRRFTLTIAHFERGGKVVAGCTPLGLQPASAAPRSNRSSHGRLEFAVHTTEGHRTRS